MSHPPLVNPLVAGPTDATGDTISVKYGERTADGGMQVYGISVFPFDDIKDDDAPILAERDRHQQVADRVYALNQQFTPLVTVPSGPVGLKLVPH